ncbi:MAG: hypothetical protein JSS15_07800 [Proteobacteria bacterium]|nr:hypothetical protein [Pseudomonadota bacterium]
MVKINKSTKKIQSKSVKIANKDVDITEYDITTKRAKVDGEYTKVIVKEFAFSSKDGLKMKDVVKLINDKSKGLKDKKFKGYISSNIDTPFGWKSSRLKPVGYQISNPMQTWGTNYLEIEKQFEDNEHESNIEKYYDNNDSIVNDFRIFLYDFPDEAGCNGKYNDCVYDALKCGFGEQMQFWKNPVEFKKFLGIERTAKVPFSMIDKIETKLNTAINIEGDHIRTSTLTTKRQINLEWLDGHVELKRTNKPIKCINFKYEKQPLIYYRDRTDRKNPLLKVYDGTTEYIMDDEEFNKHYYNYKGSKYITIPKTKKKTLKETYDYFVLANDKLKTLTKKHLSQINLCKTGTFKNTAIKLFNDLNVSLPEPENITQMEAEWINNCYRGGMLYSENGFEGELYSSDIKAMYSYHMQSNLNFPIKQGTFKLINDDDIEKFFMFGIYRAIVTQTKAEQDIVFHFNSNNTYTHTDLTRARELKLDIELIQDGKPNFLYYSSDTRIEGRLLFKPFIEYLIELESPEIKGAVKSIRNVLWGALCEVNHNIKYPDEDGNLELDSDDLIIGMKTNSSGESYPIYTKMTAQFKTNYARLAPFLTSAGRYQISNYITDNFENLNDVKRVNTDGLLSTSKPKDLKLKKDANIGEMVYEGFNEQVKIIHLNLFSNDNWNL